MRDLPSGTVTFLFTDIEGSAALWERDRVAMADAVERHLSLIAAAVEAHGGIHFKTVGDGTQAAFSTAPAAIMAAIEAQRALLVEVQNKIGPLRSRMALHAGEATPDRRGDYLAAPLNRLSRLLSTGHGAQILLTQTVQQLSRGGLPDSVALRDLGEHRLRDLLEPERVYQLLHPDLPSAFPPLRSLGIWLHNLPLQPTPFLGREREVGGVVGRLGRPDTRLLTLTGPGGIGKTRLALQAAAELLEDFPDGVYFIPLATVSDSVLVPPTIANALDFAELPDHSHDARLREALAARCTLLVLDNFEHVVEAAPLVGDLLAAAPGLKVLVTSRTPLHLRAEREYPVPALSVPDQKHPPPLEQLSQYEAVRLFLDRAQAVKPHFSIDSENARVVTEICHRLDGLPLGIELAAARLRLLPPQVLLARLEKRLPLLIGGARDAPARQRTLRDTISWSYDLLHTQEQMLFQRLAVFAGGCTLDAAEAVGNHDGTLDVFRGVEQLCEHSLLRQGVDPTGEARFTWLESIREFGLEQLVASGSEPEAREAHAAYFLALAAEAEPHLTGEQGDQAAWIARLDADFRNLRDALAWLLEERDGTRALQLLIGLQGYLSIRYFDAEAREWLEEALAMAPDAAAPLRAAALFGLVDRAWVINDPTAARAAAEQTLALARTTDDPLLIGRAYLGVGNAWELSGDVDRAAVAYAQAVATCRQTGRAGFLGLALAFQGDAVHLSGDLGTARALLDEALRLSAQVDDPWGRTVILSKRAHLARTQGEHALATRLYGDAIANAQKIGNERQVMYQIAGLAGVALACDQPERASRLLGAVAAAQEAAGIASILSDLNIRTLPQRARVILDDDVFTRAWEAGRAMPLPQAVAEALTIVDEVVAGARR